MQIKNTYNDLISSNPKNAPSESCVIRFRFNFKTFNFFKYLNVSASISLISLRFNSL